MTLAKRLEDAKPTKLSKAASKVRILTLDVENCFGQYYSFGPKVDWIHHDKEISPPRVVMVGMKWLHEAEPFVLDERMGHRAMIEATWNAMSSADVLVTYNGSKADVPWLGEHFAEYRLGRPAPYKHVDLIKPIRKDIGFRYRSLDYVATRLLGKGKQHVDMQLWIDVTQGDPQAMDQMAEYCANDVQVEEELYLDILPWLNDQPHMGMLVQDGEQMRCWACAELITEEQRWDKPARAYVREYPLYRCGCLAWNRATWLLGKAMHTRPAR